VKHPSKKHLYEFTILSLYIYIKVTKKGYDIERKEKFFATPEKTGGNLFLKM